MFIFPNFLNLPKPLFTKEGLFYDVAFSGFIGNIFERVKSGEHLWAIKLPSLQKKGFFMMLLLVVLLEIYLRELRTENVYGLLSSLLYERGAFL